MFSHVNRCASALFRAGQPLAMASPMSASLLASVAARPAVASVAVATQPACHYSSKRKKRGMRVFRQPAATYSIDEAVRILKALSFTRSTQKLDIVFQCKLEKNETIRGLCNLPVSSSAPLRVAVFATGTAAVDAKNAGADIVGAEDLVARIQAGEVDFDRCYATPDMMPLVVRVARILGPRGLMPNPKSGTITDNIATSLRTAQSSVEYRADRRGDVRVSLGTMDFSGRDLQRNIHALYSTILAARPDNKNRLVRVAYISSTFGPAIGLNVAEIDALASVV
ncbi:hypothetical protein H696_02517 [Fonticula alba]|uniref:Ribosomal protein n=1 Tax=Fonticula alba TaxID=691883 RepID=A0A058ZCB9_FONAL|nr:hypothetical protein, variant [Fonticula alba]XP_009494701.1 hypothetical protein H696_02517 [Fonticula alba]KCV71577.1 hypothetical protein H696_02517 [Fonticula alba]KCV71578.1 hypothetical protein, variant [Fonticula alba]|eukprot:XP_009494700.1 hypothetical protein, variant [Fonticula alba]